MLYSALKFLHVASVIVWVGGVITLTFLNMRLARTRDEGTLAALASASEFYGRAVIGPATGLTLLAGIASALSVGLPLSALWIIWGFAAILLSLALGATLIRITAQQLGALAATANSATAQVAALQRRLMGLNIINIVLLLSAVWAMIAKPTL